VNVFKKVLLASVATAAVAAVSAPAMAEEGLMGGELSANVAFVSDYRFRGVSFSGEDFAIQGGLDWGHESGFYIGTWGSSQSSSDAEIDVYAGFSGEAEGVSYDVGVIGYLFDGTLNPNGTGDIVEVYASVGADLGVAAATAGVYYGLDALDNTNDYFYPYLDVSVPLGEDVPVSLDGHVGITTGNGGDVIDWSIGVSTSYAGLDFSLAYVDTDAAGTLTDATAVFSVGASF